MKLEHIGIAVSSLEKSIPHYERLLGTRCDRIEEVPEQQVRTAFFCLGESKIELLEPTTPESPIARFIERRGEGVHHIALAVDNLRASVEGLEDGGFRLVDRVPRLGAEGMRIAFVHPSSTHGVLIELCEATSSLRDTAQRDDT